MAHVSSHVELRMDAFPHLAEHVECQCQEHVDVKGSESLQELDFVFAIHAHFVQ